MKLKAFRTSLVIGLALTFVIVIYPPWFAGVEGTHSWLFSAPRRAVVNWSRLSLYLVAAWIAALPAGLVWNGVADLPRRKRIMALSLILAIGFLALLIRLGVDAERRLGVTQSEVVTLEGRIEKIERQSGTSGKITVVYYSEKQKQEVAGTAQVVEETEIMIDGTAATLKDLRDGDRVRGEVRVDKVPGRKTQTIVKIDANRSEPSSATPLSQKALHPQPNNP